MSRIRNAFVIGSILIGAPAAAQEVAPSCQPLVPVRVTVTTADGAPLQGTLLCLTGRDVVLAADGHVLTTALTEVRRIETRSDPAWDGAIKGAVLPLIMWAIFCHQCDAAPMLRAAAGYAAIGAIWDGLDTNRTRIYDRRPAAAIRWRVRF